MSRTCVVVGATTLATLLVTLLEEYGQLITCYAKNRYTKTGTGDVGAITRMQEIEWLVDPASTQVKQHAAIDTIHHDEETWHHLSLPLPLPIPQDDERFDDWNDAPSHAALAIRARLNERRLIRRNIKHVKALQVRRRLHTLGCGAAAVSHTTVEPPVVLVQQEEIGIIIRVSVDELLAKMKAEAEAAAAAEAEAAAEFGANEEAQEAETDEHEEL